VHVYEVRPRKDHRGVDLIPMRSRLVGGSTNKRRMATARSRRMTPKEWDFLSLVYTNLLPYNLPAYLCSSGLRF